MVELRKMVVIGGPHDGQRVWAEPGPTLKLPVYASPCPILPGDVMAPPVNVQEVTYARVRLADRDNVILLAWVHPSVHSPLEALLDGYRKVEE